MGVRLRAERFVSGALNGSGGSLRLLANLGARGVEQLFLEASGLEAKAKERFADADIVSTALEFGKQIGRFAAEDELGDQEYVDGLTQVVLSVAPHKTLMDAFEAFNQEMFGEEGGDRLPSGSILEDPNCGDGFVRADRIRTRQGDPEA